MTWVCDKCGCEYDDDRTWAISQHKYSRHNLDTGEEYIERYKRVKSEIPEQYHEAYKKLTGYGKHAPTSIQAAVCYIESGATQEIVADTFDITERTIRKTVESLIDEGAVELKYVQKNCKKTGKGEFGKRTSGPRNWTPSA